MTVYKWQVSAQQCPQRTVLLYKIFEVNSLLICLIMRLLKNYSKRKKKLLLVQNISHFMKYEFNMLWKLQKIANEPLTWNFEFKYGKHLEVFYPRMVLL